MKKIGRFVTMLTLAAVFVCTQVVPVYAASNPVTAEIPVKVILTGNPPEPAENYSIVLKADNGSYPMPDGSGNGEAVMEIKGSGKSSFYIAYEHPGTYTYTVSQKTGKDKDLNYDAHVYEVTVYVTNSETVAGALDVVVKAEKETEQGKKCSIEFTNAYPDPKPTQPSELSDRPKTGDESNLPFYLAMAGGGALVLVVLFLTRKKTDPVE